MRGHRPLPHSDTKLICRLAQARELRVGGGSSTGSTPRSWTGSQPDSPSSPLAGEGGTSESVGTFSSGSRTPQRKGYQRGHHTRSTSSPNLTRLGAQGTAAQAASSGVGTSLPVADGEFSRRRSATAEISLASVDSDESSFKGTIGMDRVDGRRLLAALPSHAPEGGSAATKLRSRRARDRTSPTTTTVAETSSLVPGGSPAVASGLNLTVAFVFTVTLLWLTFLILFFFSK